MNEQGYAEARRLARRLANQEIDLVYSSDLSRAQETAITLLGERPLALRLDARLRECRFGAWEGLRYEEIEAKYPEAWRAWTGDPVNASPVGGESFAELAARVANMVEEITSAGPVADTSDHASSPWPVPAQQHRPLTALVVTHGAAISVLLAHLLGVDLSRYWQFSIRPASLSVLDLYSRGPVAAVIGDTSHLTGLAGSRQGP